MIRGALIVLFFCVVTVRAQVLISTNDARHIDLALDALVMTSSDPGFEKDVGKPVWALGWITNTLARPLHLAEVGDQILARSTNQSRDKLWDLAAKLMEVEVPVEDVGVVERDDLMASFVADAARAQSMIDRAFSGVGDEHRAYLCAGLLISMLESEHDPMLQDLLVEAGVSRDVQLRVEAEGRKLDGTRDARAWIDLAKNVDRGLLAGSVRLFQHAVMRMTNWSNWPASVQRIETEAGLVIIGTTGSDHYEDQALLIIDPAGDDTYTGRAGAANGLFGHPAAAIVDLDGNDAYVARGLLGAGAALWGVSFLYDHAGNDRFESAGFGSGAGMFGASWMEDGGGHDRYHGLVFSEGAGAVGFGLLIDRGGDDQYDVGLQGQGYAGVMGWGMLLDYGGHDRYFAGHVRRDHERNDDRFLSLSQGFSIGMRPHAGGGVGALVDLGGNDSYSADIYGQGVSYYYAAGFLIDAGGKDRYAVYQYGQGCGIHLSHGLLADLAGDDVYYGHILSQGSAHDYAVGLLLEHGGDDTYTGDHHTQGRALNNAFALLLDRGGVDGYFARQRDGGQGIGNSGGFRDYGSLALLLDLGGPDIYSGGFSNGAVTLRPLYGAVYDHEDPADD